MKKKVFVWVWRHGRDGDEDTVTLFSSEVEARAALSAYVLSEWSESGITEGIPMPEEPEAAINLFFQEHQECEWYSIEAYPLMLKLPSIAPPGPDNAVELSRIELNLCVSALASMSVGKAAQILGTENGVEACKVIDDIVHKLM